MISLQTHRNDSLDLNNIPVGNFSSTPQHILSSMYQTAAAPQYQPQQPFVYGNTHITYTSNPHHSRNSSTSSISRQSPTDASFALESGGYTQLSYRFDPSVNSATSAMTAQDVSKSSPLQQNHNSPSLIQAGSSPSSSVTLSPDNSSNVLPPISEVFSSSSTHNGQSPSSSGSPIQSQVVPQQPQVQSQQQQNSGNISMPSAASAHPSYFYSDAAAAAATFAAAAHAQQVAAQQAAEGAANFSTSIVSQNQQSQLASVVDPRTLPRISANASDMQALSNAIDRNRNSSSMLAINTAGLSVGAGDPSPMSAGSSTGSPIMPTLSYHQSAHHQALLNSHFMAATQSMGNGAGLIAPTQRISANRRNARSDDGHDINTGSNGDRPQKVYSFVALPGINTKKRPRRRYDEIERHYACNFPGCTKSYGTLNHLNAHVQMQKHGPKRHPSEFKELRKQWRRQKREEEERKNAENNTAKNATAGLNITSLQSI